MTVQTLYTAATGMEAMESKLDVIANNMANINTTGFKKDRANFEDVFYRQYRLPGAQDADGNRTATGIEVGLGTRVSSTQSNFKQGSFQTTNNPLDFAVEGDGFFQVQNPTGNGFYYTRAGNFNLNANGQFVLGSANKGYRARADAYGAAGGDGHRRDRPTGRCNTARRLRRTCRRSASCNWPSL